MRSFVTATALAALLAAAPLAAQEAENAAATEYDAGTVLATVDGTDITLGHLIMMRARLPQQYQQVPDATLYTALLDQIVVQTMLAGLVSDSPETDPAELRLSLDLERLSALAGLKLEELSQGEIGDEAVQAKYDEIAADFEPETEYKAAHILVEEEQAAKDLLQQINDGADFAEIAQENSTDGAAANGGDLGWFGMGRMVPEFEEAVADMAPGDVAGPIETQFGWHLIKLEETRQTEMPPLDELRPDIEAELRQEQVRAEIEKLRGEAEIDNKDVSIPAEAIRETDLIRSE